MKNILLVAVAVAVCALVRVKADSCQTTLSQNDPFHDRISFPNGDLSVRFEDYAPKEQDTDLAFGVDGNNGSFVLVPAGVRKARVVPLGSLTTLTAYFQLSNLAEGLAYSSLHFEGDDLKVSDLGDGFTNVDDAITDDLYGKTETKAKFVPQPAHVYLIRIEDPTDSKFYRIAKLMVIDVGFDNSWVTFRFDLIKVSTIGYAGACFCRSDQYSMEAPAMTSTLSAKNFPYWFYADQAAIYVILVLIIYVLCVIVCFQEPCGFGFSCCCSCLVSTALSKRTVRKKLSKYSKKYSKQLPKRLGKHSHASLPQHDELSDDIGLVSTEPPMEFEMEEGREQV